MMWLTGVSSLTETDSLHLLEIATMLFYLPFVSREQSWEGQKLAPTIDHGGRPGWSLITRCGSSEAAVFGFLCICFKIVPDLNTDYDES